MQHISPYFCLRQAFRQEKLQQIEEARAKGVTYIKGQDLLQMDDIKTALPETTNPALEQSGQIEEAKPDEPVQNKWEGIALPLR